jgi:GNAT superfamily N-acetyltransferase
MEPTGASEAPSEGRHPAHEDIAATLRSWHTTSVPEAGIEVTETWYGYLSNADGDVSPRVLLTIDRPDDVPAAIASARSSWDAPEYFVWVTDRARGLRLDQALRGAGCEPVKATTHLTLVGELRARPGPEALVVDDAGPLRLREWAEVKIKSFEDTEADPTPTRLERELDVRTRGASLETLRIVRLGEEAVGVLGYYAGADQLVFNLGTRVPYRLQGIAQAVLSRWAAEGRAAGCRSLTINADDPGRPSELYRRLGFTDEVYWYVRYRLNVGDRGARDTGAMAGST